MPALAATTTQAAAPIQLMPLREEIGIFPGPTALDGSPTWTLHDPTRNRFYRIGWREFEIISRWHAGSVDMVANQVNTETALHIEQEDVLELAQFLNAFDLIRGVGERATARLIKKSEHLHESWGQWLFHNYLFTRIPLVRPDRVLSAVYPYIRWVYTRAFAWSIIIAGVVGLYMVNRQWDVFLATLVDLFTIEGAVFFGITLGCLKVIHELGHGFTAKRYGCRVPTMGAALLVMVPVLYTDVNDAWKLTSRRKRLAIAVAGVTAEMSCAAIALCLWGFLPNGPARSAAFLVATSTWVTTLLINLSPFMRFDGYYALSDWLETPNLHHRAFEIARWWMREKVLGLGYPPPEALPERRRNFLIAFAFLTWAYRFSLFLGIAAIIFHFSVKIVGIAMMVVELGFFLVRPVYMEAKAWSERREDMHWKPRTMISAAAALGIVALLLVPWRSSVDAPGLFKTEKHSDLFVPEFGARVESINVKEGQEVGKGALLVRLASPDLDYKIQRAKIDLEILEWEMSSKGLNADLLAHSRITEQEHATAQATYRGLLEQKSRLELTSSLAGKAVDLSDGLKVGAWMSVRSRVLSVVDPSSAMVEAYLDEADLGRIMPGVKAKFYADADSRIAFDLHVVEISQASTRQLPDLYLASVYGGPIGVRTPTKNDFIPDKTLYRVTLALDGSDYSLTKVLRGRVVLQGETASIAARVWQSFLAVVVRESGP